MAATPLPPSRALASPSSRALRILYIVSNLAPHVAPSRLLQEFPTAVSAEATYELGSGDRSWVVLAFEAGRLPSKRASKALGCVLKPAVSRPRGGNGASVVKWYRDSAGVLRKQLSAQPTSAVVTAHRHP